MGHENCPELITRAKAGDEAAFERLLQQLQPQIYRFGMQLCRHPQDAEDVLQDTLVTVFNSLGDFRQEASLSTWLFTIARGFCIKKKRKEASPKTVPLDQLESGTMPPNIKAHQDEAIENKETWQAIAMAMDRLEPNHREILLLRDIQGLSSKETAEVLGLSLSATKSRLHRARASLRAQMAQPAPSKDCPDIRRIFSQYLEGDLNPDICSQMQDHLERCDRCKNECDRLKHLLHLCQTAPDQEVPAEIARKIRKSLRKALDLADGHSPSPPESPS